MSKQFIKLLISKPKNNLTNSKPKNNLTNSESENDLTNSEPENDPTNSEPENDLTNSEPENDLTNSEPENDLTNSEPENDLTNSKQSIDCPICLDEIKTNDTLNILALTCGHITCFECVFKWIESCIINRNYPLTCPVCRAELQYWEIENMFNYQPFKNNRFDIDKRVFHKYDTYLLEKSINTMDNAMWCPKGCGDAILIENDSITRIVCPGCKEVFCFKCQTKWHPETTCILYKKWLNENKQNDDQFKHFAMVNLKRCPKCLSWIQKNGGCTHMTCKNCKYEWFWTTGRKFKNEDDESPIPDEYITKPVSNEPKPKKSKKIRSVDKCVARIKFGNRKGHQCTNSALLGDRFCGVHTDWYDAVNLNFSQIEFNQGTMPNNEFNIL